MNQLGLIGISVCIVLAGCGQFQELQPDVPDRISDADKAPPSGSWDAAMIEDIRRRLGYPPDSGARVVERHRGSEFGQAEDQHQQAVDAERDAGAIRQPRLQRSDQIGV